MNNISIGVLALIIGILVGVGSMSVFGNNNYMYGNMMHQMPNGYMMRDTGNTMNMTDMMHSMNYELRGKSGDEFDRAFLAEMIVHHEGAVEMAKLALTNAKHQEIKDLAEAIISAQNTEIGEMKSWQKSWYGISN